MRPLRPILASLGLCLCAIFAACTGLTPNPIPPDQPGGINDPGSGGGDSGQSGGGSVGDVTNDGSGSVGRPAPDGTISAARVRNESSRRGDVTLRFIRDDSVVHLAFVRVLPETMTTITSPNTADTIEVSGVNDEGAGLVSKLFSFGVDFDTETPAEYLIEEATQTDPPPLTASTITTTEPGSDTVVTLGSSLLVRWSDSGGAPGAVVRVLFEPTDDSAPVPMGPAVGAALDGLNDELHVVVQDVAAGTYRVTCELDDGASLASSTAPGLVEVVLNAEGAAPTLNILTPTTLVTLDAGGLLPVSWIDTDDDDNATITFTLEGSDTNGVSVGSFAISPPIAEDPDDNDSAVFPLTDVLPGLYDLVGRIDDGELAGTSRLVDIVIVLPDPENDPPHLVLTAPSADIDVAVGESFLVAWNDSDENDNARISLLLDPDLEGAVLDGNEILIVSSLGEDSEGTGDSVTLGIPAGVATGVYRIAGAITDGTAQVVTWAPGLLRYGVADPVIDPPELSFDEPLFDVRVRMGQSFDILVNTANIPAGTQVRLFLSNGAAGGNVRADVTPAELVENAATTLTLPLAMGAIPNAAWPREFELQAEISTGETTFVVIAPGRVWIRQEVEILSVEMINYFCTDAANPVVTEDRFSGVEIIWYGGGYEERELHEPVSIWLTGDDVVNEGQEQDSLHALLGQRLESPNIVRAFQAIPRTVEAPDRVRGGSQLIAGSYRVVTVVTPARFGRITSPAFPNLVEACFAPNVP